MSTQPLFPIFLKLDGKRCLVVGGTASLEAKVQSLLSRGAEVKLVADDITDEIRKLAEEGRIRWEKRSFRTADLDGVTLVVAADRDQAVNKSVFAESEARNLPCNVVDQPALCNFYYPAVVERGQLQIAISTGGLSPSLASRIRAELEQQFGPEYGEWIDALGRARERILTSLTPSERRTRILKRIASKHALEQFRRNRQSAQRGAQ
jgi:precorrin-2 dehydrogenase / sirohydrochlorin ferrochelatase